MLNYELKPCKPPVGRPPVIVFGAGGHAKGVLAVVEAEGKKYEVIGLLDDETAKHNTNFYGYQVLGGSEQLSKLREIGITLALVAIGDNHARVRLAQSLVEKGFQLPSVIHPTVTLCRGFQIGAGVVVFAHAHIGPDVIIGDNAIISAAVIVGHDCVIGSFAHLCPGVKLGGNTRIGDGAFIGMGGVVLPSKKIGRHAMVGANAVVNLDLGDGVRAAGISAREIQKPTSEA